MPRLFDESNAVDIYVTVAGLGVIAELGVLLTLKGAGSPIPHERKLLAEHRVNVRDRVDGSHASYDFMDEPPKPAAGEQIAKFSIAQICSRITTKSGCPADVAIHCDGCAPIIRSSGIRRDACHHNVCRGASIRKNVEGDVEEGK